MLGSLRQFIAIGIFCLLGIAITAKAQQSETIKITGNIKDELKAVMPGVTIVNITTKAGVNTDDKGNFSIDAHRGDSLSARLIGYEPYYFVINKTIDFDITLKATNSSLNEVVV